MAHGALGSNAQSVGTGRKMVTLTVTMTSGTGTLVTGLRTAEGAVATIGTSTNNPHIASVSITGGSVAVSTKTTTGTAAGAHVVQVMAMGY